MRKKIYLIIIFLVLSFIFIKVNFFFKSKISFLNNTSNCLLSYEVKYIVIECTNFNDFYKIYSENYKSLLYTKIKHYSLDNKLIYKVFK
jgi:hypothetical protein